MRNLASGEAEIFIYDYIGRDPFFGGVSARDFVQQLRALNATKILVRVNSPGGDISEGVTIRNALIEHPAQIETHVDGLAASTASWCAMLPGERFIMSPHSMMMIHEPWNLCAGDAEYMHREADILDKFAGQIAEMLTEKAGGTTDQWRASMRAETWYTDAEAVAAGLADEVATDATAASTAGSGGGNQYDHPIFNTFKHVPDQLKNGRHAPASAHEPAAPENADLVKATLDYERSVFQRYQAREQR